MSLVFAAITPHPPLLIPAIGQDSLKKISKTKKALEKLEEDLYLSKPDILLVISPHGTRFKDAFSINYCTDYTTDLKQFGDLTTKLKFKGEVKLPNELKEKTNKSKDFPAVMISDKKLDHGVSVPLFYLTAHLPNVTIMPIGFCELDWKTHVEFGYLLKDLIMKTTKRVAIIASADLSHSLSTEAPAGFKAAGVSFDEKIQELLAAGNTSGLLQLDKKLVNDSEQCGFKALLIMLGILRGINYNFESYCYESPFGVGYLTANLVL
jgi:MEMO1 family protein